MKRYFIATCLIAASLVCSGCERDFYARKLIEFDTSYGKYGLLWTGSDQQLLKQKRIDMHRRFTMPDNTVIDTWVIKAKAPGDSSEGTGPKGTVLLIHGLLDSKASYLRLGERLAKMGYDVVLPDLRGHGHSGGKYVTYGALEKHDMKAVVDELFAEGAVQGPVYAFGVSMGAAVAIQYAAIEPRCKGVMAMAPYKDARSITLRAIALIAMTMSSDEFEAVLARAGQIAKFDPAEASSVAAARKLTCPILLVHGLLDTTVPADHSKAIYDAAGEPKQLIIVPWASHATLLLAREAWIAEQIERIATKGLKTKAPLPKPTE